MARQRTASALAMLLLLTRPNLQLVHDSLSSCLAIGLANYGESTRLSLGTRSKMNEGPSLTLMDATRSLCLQFFVERFPPTSPRCLDIIIFALETACRSLIRQDLFDESPFALFVWQPGSEVLGWTFNYGAHLGEFRYGGFRSLLVMSVRIQYGPHLKESYVCFELGS